MSGMEFVLALSREVAWPLAVLISVLAIADAIKRP